jgi:hypothetical protein
MVFGTHLAITVFDWARISGEPYWSNLQQSFLWVLGGGKLMFSLPFSSSGICVCGFNDILRTARGHCFFQLRIGELGFLVECLWSDVEQDFWVLGVEGDVFSAFCYFWHLCASWFWESIPWWMFFDWKFVSSISESLFYLMWSRIVVLWVVRMGFSLPVIFSAICVYGSIVFKYPLPCGHGGGMWSCGSQISLT